MPFANEITVSVELNRRTTMKKFVAALLLTLSVASVAVTTDAFARHGADDPAGHVRGGGNDDGPGHK
jgi:hypothetical protein